MNKLYFKEVQINNMTLRTEYLAHRLLKQDVRILLLTCYDSGKLEFRKKLTITKYEKFENDDNEVELYCRDASGKYNLKIGKGKIVEKNSDGPIVIQPISICVDNDSDKTINDMFRVLKSAIIDDSYLKKNYSEFLSEYKVKYNNYLNTIEDNKDKYINGLFKYYYESMIQLFNDNNTFQSVGKITAMSSYIIAKSFFKKKKKIVSYPNVFIKNFNAEFDMLILKKGIKANKYVYEMDEVEAIVELKSNGIIAYGKDDKIKKADYNDKRWFEAYITFDNNFAKINKKLEEYDSIIRDKNSSKSNDKLEEYDSIIRDKNIISKQYNDIKQKICNKDFYYFCLYEKNNINTAAYENTYIDILAADGIHKGVYFAITDGDDGYVIPIDYDIDSIL